MSATPDAIIKDLVSEIRGGVGGFDNSLPSAQRQIMSDVDLLVKRLETNTGGDIIANAKNLRIVGEIQTKLDAIINSPEYRASVKDYLSTFNKVSELNNDYYKAIAKGYKQPPLVKDMQKQSVEAAIKSLTSAGISTNVTSKIQDILRVNITTGAPYAALVNQLRDFITDNKTGEGALQKYVKQITTDALNQYSASYSQAATKELGFEWYRYTGAEIDTTRPFCNAMLDKVYFHASEIPALLRGDFKEFKAIDGELNKKSGLPEGMVTGTTPATFFVYRGGYNCGHQIVGVPTESVPVDIRKAHVLGNKAPKPEPKKTEPKAPAPPAPAEKAPAPANGITAEMQKALDMLKNYKPAKTVSEAAEIANAGGVSRNPVDYSAAKSTDIRYLNELNKALLKTIGEGAPPYNKIYAEYLKERHPDTGAITRKNDKSSIAVNGTGFDKYTGKYTATSLRVNLNNKKTDYKYNNETGWFIPKDLLGAIWHEYGHALTCPRTTRKDYESWSKELDGLRIPVSRYGKTTGVEALAEIYCLYKQSGVEALEPDWITFFNKHSTEKIPTK